MRDHNYHWCCVWITQTQIAKFEAIIVRDVLGSVFVLVTCLEACLNLATCLVARVMSTNQWFVFTFNMVTCLNACFILVVCLGARLILVMC